MLHLLLLLHCQVLQLFHQVIPSLPAKAFQLHKVLDQVQHQMVLVLLRLDPGVLKPKSKLLPVVRPFEQHCLQQNDISQV